MEIDLNTRKLINKTCKGKNKIKLTIGTFAADKSTIYVFDDTGEVVNEDYIYEIGSITKTFTASLLAKSIYNGSMSLDDQISTYIDGLDSKRYYPTLKRLITHTAGYPGFLPLTKTDNFKYIMTMIFGGKKEGVFPFHLDLDNMKRLLNKYSLKDKDYPWKYSNFGFALIGYAISMKEGRNFKEIMDSFISEELCLKNSFTGTSPGRNLRGYNSRNNDIGNWIWGDDLTAPAGDISSTASDLLEYARIIMYEEIPYLNLYNQKYTIVSHPFFNDCDMGFGWLLYKSDNNIIWHNGGTGAFRSFLSIDKGKKHAVVILSNYFVNTDKIGHMILNSLSKCGDYYQRSK